VVDVDGSDVEGPKALCELQGYVYDAWQRTAEIFEALGKQDAAQSLRTKANVLYDRFYAAFWDESLPRGGHEPPGSSQGRSQLRNAPQLFDWQVSARRRVNA